MSPALHAEGNGGTLLKPWGCVEVRFYPPGSTFIGFEPGIQSLRWVC